RPVGAGILRRVLRHSGAGQPPAPGGAGYRLVRQRCRRHTSHHYHEGGHHMKKVKITVLKTTLDQELAAEYGAEGLTACPMMREGQVFYADYAKPEGLCDEAWKAIYQYVFALAHGAGDGLFYYGDWIRKPGVAICSCNDGLRPVIFKLEATGE